MNCLILAAGLGTRLGSITTNTPKCLLEINGQPLLYNWIKKLEKINVKKVVINTHYLSKKVTDFINNLETSLKITISHETKLLGTAMTLKDNLKFLIDDDCLFLHADNYIEGELFDFIKYNQNRPKNCLITMYGFKTTDYKNSGIVITDDQSIVTHIYEKKNIKYGNWANGAILLLSKKFMKNYHNYITDESVDFCKDIIPNFQNKIFFYKSKNKFFDIGIPKNFSRLNT